MNDVSRRRQEMAAVQILPDGLLRMSLIEVEKATAPFFSAARQTEDEFDYTVFALDPPDQLGIIDDPEENGRLVVMTEIAYRGLLDEVSIARRARRG